MVAQGLVIAAVSVALCACAASPSPQRASVQNAVYMVGDSTPRREYERRRSRREPGRVFGGQAALLVLRRPLKRFRPTQADAKLCVP